MIHFKLVRYRNGDFVLSAGSRFPVDPMLLCGAAAETGTDGGHPADLLLKTGDGLRIDVA